MPHDLSDAGFTPATDSDTLVTSLWLVGATLAVVIVSLAALVWFDRPPVERPIVRLSGGWVPAVRSGERMMGDER